MRVYYIKYVICDLIKVCYRYYVKTDDSSALLERLHVACHSYIGIFSVKRKRSISYFLHLFIDLLSTNMIVCSCPSVQLPSGFHPLGDGPIQGSYVFRNSKIQGFPGLFQGSWKSRMKTFTTNCNHYKATMCSKCSDSILSSGFKHKMKF